MKTLKLVLILACSLFSTVSIAQEKMNTIKVIVTNIQSNNGDIKIGLYDNQNHFLEKVYKSIDVKATEGTVEATFENIPNGEYAISLYHDEDNNNELNKRFFIIPIEPYGISNNAKEMYSAPSWEKAKFSLLNQHLIQKISL